MPGYGGFPAESVSASSLSLIRLWPLTQATQVYLLFSALPQSSSSIRASISERGGAIPWSSFLKAEIAGLLSVKIVNILTSRASSSACHHSESPWCLRILTRLCPSGIPGGTFAYMLLLPCHPGLIRRCSIPSILHLPTPFIFLAPMPPWRYPHCRVLSLLRLVGRAVFGQNPI